MGEGPDSMNFKSQSPWRIVSLSPTGWIFSNETSQTRKSAKNYPPNVPKKHQIPSTVSTRPGIAKNRPISGPSPAGNCTNHQLEIVPMGAFLQPDAFSLPLVPSFFVQIQLASPVRISHLKGEVWTQISHEDLELIVTFYDL